MIQEIVQSILERGLPSKKNILDCYSCNKYSLHPECGYECKIQEGFNQAIDDYEAWYKATELTEEEIREIIIYNSNPDADCSALVAKAITKAREEKRG